MGDAALRLADRLGPGTFNLIPWQEGAVLDCCRTDDEDQFAASEYGLLVARQNGKGGALELRAVAGVVLPVFGERRILWTAHTWKTAKDAHQRVANIFLSHPDLKALLKNGNEDGISYGNDSRGITLKNGNQILFFTRSATAGRGLWADLLICDEALDLNDDELSVLGMTTRTAAMRTGRRAQTLYVSTPPDEARHKNGVVFARIRKKALTGVPGICWNEWSVPTRDELAELAAAEGRVLLDDPRLTTEQYWPQGNPSLGYLFDIGVLRADLAKYGPREFLVEGLAAGDHWPDPDADPDADALAVPQGLFTTGDRLDPTSTPLNPVVLGLDVSPGRQVTLTAAGWRADSRKHIEVIQTGQGTGWVIDVLTRVIADHDPADLVLDELVVGLLGAQLRAAGIEPTTTGRQQMAQASMGLVDDLLEDRVRHRGDQPLVDAAESAGKRPLGDGWAFNRRGGIDISPLVSAALASWGLENVAQPTAPPPPAARSLGPDLDNDPTGRGAALTGAGSLTDFSSRF